MSHELMFKQLDDAEERLLTRWDSWLKAAFASIPWGELERLARSGSGPKVLGRLPPLVAADTGKLAVMLAEHGAEMVATGQVHGYALVEELHSKYRGRKLADDRQVFKPYTGEPVTAPEDAISQSVF